MLKLYKLLTIFIALLLLNTPIFAAVGEEDVYQTPNYEASPSAIVSPTPITSLDSDTCVDLKVIDGEGDRAPAEVTFEAKIEGVINPVLRYHFGDGTVEESGTTTTHTYQTGGTYDVYAEVKDEMGKWSTSPNCRTSVSLTTSRAARAHAACTELQITSGQDAVAPAYVEFKVIGFDNQGGVETYTIDYGDGETATGITGIFQHQYDNPGSYTAIASFIDSQGQTQGGSKSDCTTVVRVKTQAMEVQPETGVSPALLLSLVALGVLGVTLLSFRPTQ